MKCFYHSDIDGKCAGAIVKKHMKESGEENESDEYISIDYKDDFPFDKINKDEEIHIVDFSLQKPGDFKRLLEITEDVIWIDHHISAIEKHQEHSGLMGIRDIACSGCELTWMYFYIPETMPLAVKYAGRYDVWDFSEHGEILNEFQAGMGLYDNEPQDTVWEALLDNDISFRHTVLLAGRTALLYRRKLNAELIKDFAFYAKFEGYKAICCNAGRANSQLFDSVKEDYDIMIAFVTDYKQWKVSIYTNRDDIDCAKLAAKYGGGGHKGAAGFLCENLPFKKRKN